MVVQERYEFIEAQGSTYLESAFNTAASLKSLKRKGEAVQYKITILFTFYFIYWQKYLHLAFNIDTTAHFLNKKQFESTETTWINIITN